MRDLIVIGGGIIGSSVAKYFGSQGLDVLLLDDNRPLSGTRPSGGHLKPSWFGSMKKAVYEPAMETLDNLWGLTSSEFVVWPTKIKTTVYRIDTDEVIEFPKKLAKVLKVETKDKYPVVRTSKHDLKCKNVVVAAGVWCSELVDGLDIKWKQGVSFRFKGVLKREFIKPWAPYKQVVAHQQSKNEVWIGDGSAILKKNWDSKRTSQCLSRCRKALGEEFEFYKKLTGLRPYCVTPNGDPCLFQKVSDRVWVATGAGKSGTISAGWIVNKLAKEIK